MKKGQLTVEFLIILVAMLLLFTNISVDLMNYSLENTLSLQTGEVIRSSKSMLNNAYEIIDLQGPGARKLVSVRAPSDCDFLVNEKNVTMMCQKESASYSEYDNHLVIQSESDVKFSCYNCINFNLIKSGYFEQISVYKE